MRSPFQRTLVTIVLAFTAILLTLLLLAFWPGSPPTAPDRRPITDYETARARAAALLANSPAAVRAECRGTVLDHGHRTRDAYVLLHGLTNCPAQFRLFADQLYARGANVLLPRLPYHGYANRMTSEQARLTAQDLIDSASEAVDLAHGYGERVIVVGLSISGVSTAWLAQEREDIDLAVIIAPFLAPHGLPTPATAPFANLLLRFPNAFIWWDSAQKENLAGSPVSYPRFATHSIGATMALGLDLFSRARKAPPRAGKILIVTSPADTAISADRVRELEALWRGHARTEQFPAAWRVPHDCIDPAQPGGQIARVYPQLIEWMDAQLP